MKFLFDLFPIILFFVAFKWGETDPEAATALLTSLGLHLNGAAKPGVLLATLVAIVATFGQIAWVWTRHRKVDAMLWVSLTLIVVFGGATLWLQDEAFIKWKPTVLYWLFAASLLLAPLLFGRNLIRLTMEKQLTLPETAWTRLNQAWSGFFAFMGGANLFVASHYSTDAWVNFKLFGSLGLMVLFILGQSVYLARQLKENP